MSQVKLRMQAILKSQGGVDTNSIKYINASSRLMTQDSELSLLIQK